MQFPTSRTRLSSASAAVLTALCATAATVLTGCSGHTAEPQAANSAPITSTTRIATAGVLGNQRLTAGGTIKRAKPKQKSVKKRQAD